MKKYFFGILLFSLLFIAACSDGSIAGQAIQSKSVQCNRDTVCKTAFSNCLSAQCTNLAKTSSEYRNCATTCLDESAKSLPQTGGTASTLADCSTNCKTRYSTDATKLNECVNSCQGIVSPQTTPPVVSPATSVSSADCFSACRTKSPNGGADYDNCARSCPQPVQTSAPVFSLADCQSSCRTRYAKDSVQADSCAKVCLTSAVSTQTTTSCSSDCRTRYPNDGANYDACTKSCPQVLTSTTGTDCSSQCSVRYPTAGADLDKCKSACVSQQTSVIPATNSAATAVSASDCLSACRTKSSNGGADYDTCARSCPIVSTTPVVVQKIFGDVTGDLKVTSDDTTCYQEIAVGKTDAACKETDVAKIDLNCDGKIDVSDALLASKLATKAVTVDSNRNNIIDCAEVKKDTSLETPCNDPDGNGILGYLNVNINSLYTKTKIAGGISPTENVNDKEDFCSSTKRVVEYYCQNDKTYGWNGFDCPQGTSCSNGACTLDCVDPDSTSSVGVGDQGVAVQSTTKGFSSLDVAMIYPYAKKILGGYEFTDTCIDTATVREGFCSEKKQFAVKDVPCQSGTSCKDGSCQTIQTLNPPVTSTQTFTAKCLQVEKTTPKVGSKPEDSICAKRGLEKAADIEKNIQDSACLGIYKGIPIITNFKDRKIAYGDFQGSSFTSNVYWNKWDKCNKRIASVEGKDNWESYLSMFMVPKTVEEAATCIELVGKSVSDYFDEKCLATP